MARLSRAGRVLPINDTVGTPILNVLTETEPCVFHGNGGADMSRVIKFILGPAYLDLDDLADDHEVASQNVLPESSRIQTVKPLIKQPANKRAPAGFHRAAAATKPVPKPAIGIVVHDEEPQLLIECLRHARAACAHALIFVISDGTDLPEYAAACRSYRAVYRADPHRLILLRHGAAWWHRFFSIAIGFKADCVIKLDPSVKLLRRFRTLPPLDVFGQLQEGTIRGGIQGLSLHAAQQIVASGVCLDPAYRNFHTWACDDGARTKALHSGQIDVDSILFHLATRLGLRYGSWPELDRTSATPVLKNAR